MKKTQKLLITILSVAMSLTATISFASCNKSLNKPETTNLIAQLQATMGSNKSELDKKITTLTEEYKAKDSKLLAQITSNQQAINVMQIEYAEKIAKLELSNEINAKEINDLKREYEEKVNKLENAIATANATIERNKEELNNAISVLTATYESKMAQINNLLETLQNADTTQDEKIVALANKITALEEATRITDIEFTDNGDLLITFGDGSTQTVKTQKQEGTEGLEYYPLPDGTYAVAQGNTKYLDDIVIPAAYNGKPVTVIDEDGFQLSKIKSITIPSTITDIKVDAFYGCSNLTHVYITDFTAWCAIPFKNKSDNPLYYAKNLYWNNNLVTDLVIPDGVTSIGDYTFNNCSSLMSVIIPDSVTSIGKQAFYQCSNLMNLYYKGTQNDYNQISIGSYAYEGSKVTQYYYSATRPTTSGNYWYYIGDIPKKW